MNPYAILLLFFIFTKSIHPMIKIKRFCSEKKPIYTEQDTAYVQQTSNLIQGRFIVILDEGWFFVSWYYIWELKTSPVCYIYLWKCVSHIYSLCARRLKARAYRKQVVVALNYKMYFPTCWNRHAAYRVIEIDMDWYEVL